MEKRNFGELVKVAAVGTILLILLGGALLLRQASRKKKEVFQVPPSSTSSVTRLPTSSSTLYPTVGKYFFTPESSQVKIGQIFELSVVFSAPDKVLDGGDVVLRFDPSFLEVLEVVEGDYFGTYPRKTIDNKIGNVKITGIRAKVDTPLSETASFAKISYRAKKTGETQVTFDFVKGKTNRTTLVEKGTSRNILGSVFPVTITIEP